VEGVLKMKRKKGKGTKGGNGKKVRWSYECILSKWGPHILGAGKRNEVVGSAGTEQVLKNGEKRIAIDGRERRVGGQCIRGGWRGAEGAITKGKEKSKERRKASGSSTKRGACGGRYLKGLTRLRECKKKKRRAKGSRKKRNVKGEWKKKNAVAGGQ